MRLRALYITGLAGILSGCVPGSPIYIGPAVASVEGVVMSLEDHTAAAGAEVCLFGSDTTCVRSDHNGRYKVYYSINEIVTVSFRIPGLRPALIESFSLVPPTKYELIDCTVSTRITLSTEPGHCRDPLPGVIQGEVRNEQVRSAISDVWVCALGSQVQCAKTGGNGRYTIHYRPAETVDIWFRPDSDRPALVAGFEVRANEIHDVFCFLDGREGARPEALCQEVEPAEIVGSINQATPEGSSAAESVEVCVQGSLRHCTRSDESGAFQLYYPIAETVNFWFAPRTGEPAVTPDTAIQPGSSYVLECSYGEDVEGVSCESGSSGS